MVGETDTGERDGTDNTASMDTVVQTSTAVLRWAAFEYGYVTIHRAGHSTVMVAFHSKVKAEEKGKEARIGA